MFHRTHALSYRLCAQVRSRCLTPVDSPGLPTRELSASLPQMLPWMSGQNKNPFSIFLDQNKQKNPKSYSCSWREGVVFPKIQPILTIMTVKNPCTCLLLRTTLSNANLENREKQNNTKARKLLLFLGSYKLESSENIFGRFAWHDLEWTRLCVGLEEGFLDLAREGLSLGFGEKHLSQWQHARFREIES